MPPLAAWAFAIVALLLLVLIHRRSGQRNDGAALAAAETRLTLIETRLHSIDKTLVALVASKQHAAEGGEQIAEAMKESAGMLFERVDALAKDVERAIDQSRHTVRLPDNGQAIPMPSGPANFTSMPRRG